MTRIYRVQDDEGRGPYRPGTSHKWTSEFGRRLPPTWMEEFGTKFLEQRDPSHHIGCGFRTMQQLHAWFMPEELDRLRLMGYAIVSMNADEILAESHHQLVFTRIKPLRNCHKEKPDIAPG